VPERSRLRLDRPGGGTLELEGGATLLVDDDETVHVTRGRARLEGRAAVLTPRARVVGTASDTLAEIHLEPKEPDMIGTRTAVAAASLGTLLTVVVVRGHVEVHPVAPPAPAITLSAGERATVPGPPAVAAAERAVSSQPLDPPVELECAAGGPVAECGGGPGSCEECDQAVDDPPAAARVTVHTDGAPSLGPADARVTIVEFADYQCPFCEKALSSIHSLAQLYPRDVRVVLKNFPMPGHRHARLAAEAALAAGEQGKYWEMHDLLLANQGELGRAALESYAKQLGLDLDRFRAALDEGRFSAQVARDLDEAAALGLKGVPAFVINGRVILGARPLDQLKAIVEEELAR
jgi:protein-disulfide isomerase